MAGRFRLFFRKTRRYRMKILVAAMLCLLIFLTFVFSLGDKHSAFEAVYPVDYQLDIPTSREGLKELSVNASHVTLEIGMADDISQPRVQLFGKGYKNQFVKVDLKNTSCHIRLMNAKKMTPSKMTMRVLLPQSDLNKIQLQGEALNLHAERLRAGVLRTDVSTGYVAILDTKVNNLWVETVKAPIRLSGNRATSVETKSQTGSMTFLENTIQLIRADNQQAGIFFYNRGFLGQTLLTNKKGNITVLTQRLPYNILVDAQSGSQGSVAMKYTSRFWKNAQVIQQNKQTYVGSVGENQKHFLECQSDTGKIVIGLRQRYSDLDPYAKDYIYEKNNPYRIERATYTK